ncbi:hypothetical protein IGI04_024241 [Brassica rapa subsp. trilocularis]|uniref:GRAM domain-containing protein n=1 Tax=Brassica rapa subsp. trilocularis TaxID=1813537 RepID=A0ABQ7M660_BRACM|nr:hypothetical protein IGI04_024241 [Brassica rapa subsp. trilocularis]
MTHALPQRSQDSTIQSFVQLPLITTQSSKMTLSTVHQQILALPAVKTAPAGYLPYPASINKLQIPTPSKKSEQSKKKSILRTNSFTNGTKDQSKLGPKLTETVKRKLSLGAKILQMGGLEKIYKRLFRVYNEEKLFKAYQCYLSTTAGPIAGLLFISSKKIAFCSERSIKVASPQGDLTRVHYKVSIPLCKIKGVDQSLNTKKPSQKYIEVVTFHHHHHPQSLSLSRSRFKIITQSSKIMKMSRVHQQVLAFPAVKTSPAGYLPDPASINKLQIPPPSKKSEQSKKKSILRTNSFTSGAREQSKLAPKLTETVKRKLSLGAKIIQMGGLEKIYKRLFRVYDEEKLFKAYQCYLSTTAGPIAGLLFISSKKIAFCSERSIKVASPQGDLTRVHYKVSIPLCKIKGVNQSMNTKKPSHKKHSTVSSKHFLSSNNKPKVSSLTIYPSFNITTQSSKMTLSTVHQEVLAFPAVKTAPAGYLPDPASINKVQIPSPSKKSEQSKKK